MLVATLLRKAGYDADVLDAGTIPGGMDGVFGRINKYNFLIMLSSTMASREDAANLRKFKKINPGLKTIVFGAHATFMPGETLLLGGVDFVVRREAETVIKELIDAFAAGAGDAWKKVQGIGWRENGKTFINDFHPFMQNLDDLPIADRDLLPKGVDYFNPIVKRVPYTTMITSRGCPGRCIYCSSPPFYGNKYRLQTAPRVLEEMEYLAKKGYREIFFRDETFTAFRRRVVEICEGLIRSKINLTWICSTRVDTADLELMRIMKRSGCHMLRVGVETGAQELLDNIKKGITVEQTENFFRNAHLVCLDTHAHCMLGVPGETAGTIEETIKFVKKIDPTIVTFGICTPYPGTELFETVKKNHPEIKDGSQCNLDVLHTNAFYNQYFTSLSPEELRKAVRTSYRKFYLRPGYIFRWFMRIKNLDEFRRVTLAATQVLQFIGLGD